MFIFFKSDWEKLGEQERRTLWFLRGLRDRLADELSYDLRDALGEEADETIERFLTLNNTNYSFRKLRDVFVRRDHQADIEQIEILQKIVFRIGRLEREFSGRPIDRYYEKDLIDA
ncbi:MAG TPA: hypothetical protein VHX90_01190 [Verrucomicrobiae bacterium]|nr:hypothetical protein [Verrucomicrobiae bacterium]